MKNGYNGTMAINEGYIIQQVLYVLSIEIYNAKPHTKGKCVLKQNGISI